MSNQPTILDTMMSTNLSSLLRLYLILILATCLASSAASPPCNPCAGIRVTDPAAIIPALVVEPLLEDEARLYASWSAELDGTADIGVFEGLRAVGGTPWAEVLFRTASPLLAHVDELEEELAEVARLAAAAGERAHFQIVWRPAPNTVTPAEPAAAPSAVDVAKEYAFLLKRAAVAITGRRADARIIAQPPGATEEELRALYGEEIAAYADGVALTPAAKDEQQARIALLSELDPGKPIVLWALPWPEDARRTVARAAENAQAGFAVTFFDFADRGADQLVPLKLLAREFHGDLSFDPYSLPSGVAAGWTFVRGSDLGLRVIAETWAEGALDPDQERLEMKFPDNQLRSPTEVDLATGEERSVFGQERTADALTVPISDPASVVFLRLERMSAAELEGLEEELTVADERQLPVEEILRRLQAFEDAQQRKLDHYQADNILHLRFRPGNGLNTFEAAFDGPFFYRRGENFDWVWKDFYINGVKWKGDKLPEIPLIQPEKSVALPLEINFDKRYSYRLRGTGVEEGRDVWVVDFAPLEVTPGEPLYRGTVWIDREIYARVKTRGLQVGLEGEVISNEETMIFSPVDADGQPAAWSPKSYFLPLRIVGQQILSVLNSATQVEKETVLSNVRINGESFERERQAAYASERTMVRDTDEGMRYLIKDKETGERIVQMEPDTTRLFLLGGAFYDSTQDFPLPLAGVNYLALDFRGTGKQLNVFFGGALLIANLSEPRLFGSRWDAGANVFGLFVATGDEQFRGGRAINEEEVDRRRANTSLFVGRPIGNFFKLDFTYQLAYDAFSRAKKTAPDFILPQDTLTHTFETALSYSRAGYRAAVQGSFSKRSDWQPWGLPGSGEYDPDHEDYIRYKASLAKTWWLPKFLKFGMELEHLNGSDLDRFSKYDFSFFSDSRVRGYQSGLVRAEEANGLHLNFGFDLGQVIRVELNSDTVWASDQSSGLDNELLSGIGLNGTTRGPWNTLVNFDLGYPVTGPAKDPVVFVAFLKLFR